MANALDTLDMTPTHTVGPALITQLGMIEGEILSHLEEEDGSSASQLLGTIPARPELVLMAIGSLIRQGLVRVAPAAGPDLLLEPVRESAVTWN